MGRGVSVSRRLAPALPPGPREMDAIINVNWLAHGPQRAKVRGWAGPGQAWAVVGRAV